MSAESTPIPAAEPVLAQRRGHPLPFGAMVQLTVSNIHEGKFLKRVDAALRKALAEYMEYQRIMSECDRTATGAVTITAKIKVKRDPKMQQFFSITTTVGISTPTPTAEDFVKPVNGKLLVQPTGGSQFDPDQQVLFDANGNPIGGTDPHTGETFEAPAPVAGRIGTDGE